jgi:RecB family endonuclease NucS
MSLCPRPQHPVPEIVLNEKFNKHRLRMFLSLGLCDYDYRGRLQSYLAAAGDDSSVQIVYTDPESASAASKAAMCRPSRARPPTSVR